MYDNLWRVNCYSGCMNMFIGRWHSGITNRNLNLTLLEVLVSCLIISLGFFPFVCCRSVCHQNKMIFAQNLTGVLTDGATNYKSNQRCEWLIIAPDYDASTNARMQYITLDFKSKKTECNYDYIMVHDGDSYDSPLLASLSGDSPSNLPHRIVATSGKMLVYLFSDINTDLEGFEAFFSISACPSNCNGNGECRHNRCYCDSAWTGRECSQPACPYNCEDARHGHCRTETELRKCECNDGYIGLGCGMSTSDDDDGSWWTVVYNYTGQDDGSGYGEPGSEAMAGHAGTYIGGHFYIFGGYNLIKPLGKLLRYNFQLNEWLQFHTSTQPSPRFFHTITAITEIHSDRKNYYLFLFGGDLGNDMLSDQTWIFDIDNSIWSPSDSVPSGVCQHAAAVVNFEKEQYIYVYGGRTTDSVDVGLSSVMYRFDWKKKLWQKLNFDPGGVRASKLRVAGHSMVYDSLDRTLVVFGGFRMDDQHKADYSNMVFLYSVDENRWAEVKATKSPSWYMSLPFTHNVKHRSSHTANIVGDFMVVYGGNTNSIDSNTCFSLDILFYNLRCHNWILNMPKMSRHRQMSFHGGRFSHASAVINDSVLLIHGGYDGTVMNNLLAFKLPKSDMVPPRNEIEATERCQRHILEGYCNADVAASCTWKVDSCVSVTDIMPACGSVCSSLKDCVSCTTFKSYIQNTQYQWESQACAWCVQDSTCYAVNIGRDHAGLCKTRPSKRNLEPWWDRFNTTLLNEPSSCLGKNIPPGVIATEYYPNSDFSEPDKVTHLEKLSHRFEVIEDVASLGSHILTIQGFIRPHKISGDYLKLKLLSANGMAELNLSSTQNPTDIQSIVRVGQHKNRVESTSEVIYLSNIKDARCYFKIKFNHTGNAGWIGSLEAEWDAGSMDIPFPNEDFKSLEIELLEPFQSSVLHSVATPCMALNNCLACLTDMSCAWCQSKSICVQRSLLTERPYWCVQADEPVITTNAGMITEVRSCGICRDHPTCHHCVSDPRCGWHDERCDRRGMRNAVTEFDSCPRPCNMRMTCGECVTISHDASTAELKCTWCSTMQKCYRFTSHHLTAYPFGQCAFWVNKSEMCTDCPLYTSCKDCLGSYQCGWCSNVNNPLQGYCTKGGFTQPHISCNSANLSMDPEDELPEMRWDYSSCPDVNECELEWPAGKILHSCHDDATCTNTNGSYSCRCHHGYWGDGLECERTCYMECVHGRCSGRPDYTCICELGWTSLKKSLNHSEGEPPPAECDVDCGCNLLSMCSEGPGICDACQGNTTGSHCEECLPGHYHGHGPGCHPCMCNGHGMEEIGRCDQDTGYCHCQHNTKGLTCEICDNGYYGDPRDGGTCYRMCEGRTMINASSGGFGSWVIAKKQMGSLLRRKEERIDVEVVDCEWTLVATADSSVGSVIEIVINKHINVPCYTNEVLVYDGIPNEEDSVLLGSFCRSSLNKDITVYAKSGIATLRYIDVLPVKGYITGFNATFTIEQKTCRATSMLVLENVDAENDTLEVSSDDEIGDDFVALNLTTVSNRNFQECDISPVLEYGLICPGNCSYQLGHGYCRDGLCHCAKSYTGPDCHLVKDTTLSPLYTRIEWAENRQFGDNQPWTTVGHTMVSMGQYLWLFGGFTAGRGTSQDLWRYDTGNKEWVQYPSHGVWPSARYHHTAAKHPSKNGFLLHGGILQDGHSDSVMWLYNEEGKWQVVDVSRSLPSLSSHTMTFCGGSNAYIIGGYNSRTGYNRNVWIFEAENSTVTPIHGRHIRPPTVYGHSAICDDDTGEIYIYGGLETFIFQLPSPTDVLYAFETKEHLWRPVYLRRIQPLRPSPRAFHSALPYSSGSTGGMLLFGGRVTSGDTSDEIWLFTFRCRQWIKLFSPVDVSNMTVDGILTSSASAQIADEYYFFGGVTHGLFGNKMMVISDISPCLTATDPQECRKMNMECKICARNNSFVCLPPRMDTQNYSCEEVAMTTQEDDSCDKEVPANCSSLRDCRSCLSVLQNPGNNLCQWCQSTAVLLTDTSGCRFVNDSCDEQDITITSRRNCNHCFGASCSNCISKSNCEWDETEVMYSSYEKILKSYSCHTKSWDFYYTTAPVANELTMQPAVPILHEAHLCPTRCDTYRTCDTCLGIDDWHDKWRDCIWSSGLGRCLDAAFVPLLCEPGGMCGILSSKGPISCPAPSCDTMRFAWECVNQPGCGWLQTGMDSGTCMEGSSQRPFGDTFNSAAYTTRWWYYDSPVEDECAMGLDDCLNDTKYREKCQDLDQGYECVCQDGYSRMSRTMACTPVCSEGCFRGMCVHPDTCKCEFGYTGVSCNVTCQCNGKSDCLDASHPDKCLECQHNTVGDQCESCSAMFVGDPTKDIECVPCKTMCNGRAEICTTRSQVRNRIQDLIGTRGPTLEELQCVGCHGNSQGRRCEECKDGYFMYKGKECRPCECNGHSKTCDRATGGFCKCQNHTMTSDPSCDILVSPERYPSRCWSMQCDKCAEPYEGNPQNGGHCYRKIIMLQEMCFNPTSQTPCLTGDYSSHGVSSRVETHQVLPAGQAILFALSPKYTNVDIRIMVDITFGELTVFLSDRPDVFFIRMDSASGKHIVIPNEHLVDIGEGGRTRYRRQNSPNDEMDSIAESDLKPGRTEDEHSLKMWRYHKSKTMMEKNLRKFSDYPSSFQKHLIPDSPKQDDTKLKRSLSANLGKLKLRVVNGSLFNSFASLPPDTALIVEKVQNRLVISIPHASYALKSTKFYVILLGGMTDYPVKSDNVAEDHEEDRAKRAIPNVIEYKVVDKTAGLLLCRQDQTHIDLFVFFSVFFSCFFLFLAICIVTWKVKQGLDVRQARRARHIEMQHMASRPFACVYVTLADYNPEPVLASAVGQPISHDIIDVTSDPRTFTSLGATTQLFQARSCPAVAGHRAVHVWDDGAGTSGFSSTTSPSSTNSSSLPNSLTRNPIHRRLRKKITARRGVDCLSLDLSRKRQSEDNFSCASTMNREGYKSAQLVEETSLSDHLLVAHSADHLTTNKMPLLNSTAYIKQVQGADKTPHMTLVPSSSSSTPSPTSSPMPFHRNAHGVEIIASLGKGGSVQTVRSRKILPPSSGGVKTNSGVPATALPTSSETKYRSTPELPVEIPAVPTGFRGYSMSRKSPIHRPRRTSTFLRSTPERAEPQGGSSKLTRSRFSSRGKSKTKKHPCEVESKDPGPVACEPTDNYAAAVNTVIIQLPGDVRAPMLVCLGSSLVTTRNMSYPMMSDVTQVSRPHFKSRTCKMR